MVSEDVCVYVHPIQVIAQASVLYCVSSTLARISRWSDDG